MKITLDFSRDLSYSAKASMSDKARQILSDPDMARDLMEQILSGNDKLVAMNGTVFTRKRPCYNGIRK